MKKTIVVFGVLAVMNGMCAAKKESPFKAMDEARAEFNKCHGEVFRATEAMDYRVLPDEARFDRAKGESSWVLAMPFKNDSRVKFVKGVFRDGAFVSGELFKFGLKSEKIDSAAFAALRRESAMLAIKEGSKGKGRQAAFYPALSVSDVQRNNYIRFGIIMGIEPNKRYLAGLCGIARPLGVDMKKVRYVYTITTPDGDVLEMGSESRSAGMTKLMRSSLETLYPEKKGRYSDRDIVDIYATALVTFRPAGTQNASNK